MSRAAILAEAEALQVAARRLDDRFNRAIELILSSTGKVVVTGMGKSGHIGQKIASTLCSTGTPAVFLHAAEATHGDLGIYSPGDPTIMISKSGATGELVNLIPTLRLFRTPIIAILGNVDSPLSRSVDVVLDARVSREADPLNVAPTSSSTVALALGDALASGLMHARRFSHEDFAQFHPSGQLGRNLNFRVSDVMHADQDVACVSPGDSVKEVVIKMSQYPLGAACVVDAPGMLLGIITDGDLRRALQRYDDIRYLKASEIMTSRPVTVLPDASLKDAAQLMEDRDSQISVLPVVNESLRCLGLVRIHDIYQTGLP